MRQTQRPEGERPGNALGRPSDLAHLRTNASALGSLFLGPRYLQARRRGFSEDYTPSYASTMYGV